MFIYTMNLVWEREARRYLGSEDIARETQAAEEALRELRNIQEQYPDHKPKRCVS